MSLKAFGVKKTVFQWVILADSHFSYGSGLHQTTSHPVFIQKRMKCAAAAHTSSNFYFLQLCSTDPVTPFMPLACPIILGTGGKIWHMDYPKAHNSALSKSTSTQYCKAADFIILELGHSLYIVELLEISTIFIHTCQCEGLPTQLNNSNIHYWQQNSGNMKDYHTLITHYGCIGQVLDAAMICIPNMCNAVIGYRCSLYKMWSGNKSLPQ